MTMLSHASPNLGILGLLLAALAPTPVVKHGHLESWNPGPFGSYFVWAQGWLQGHHEDGDDVDLGASTLEVDPPNPKGADDVQRGASSTPKVDPTNPEDDKDGDDLDLGAASAPKVDPTNLPNLTIPCFKITIPFIHKIVDLIPNSSPNLTHIADLIPNLIRPHIVDLIPNLTIPRFNITIPIFDLVEPCGTFQMPAEGITFKTPFGSQAVPGVDEINRHLDIFDSEFEKYSSYVAAFVVVFFAFVNLGKKEKRQKLILSFKQMASGHLEGDQNDPMMSAEETKQLAKDKKDPKSAHFVCPGNIYRLLTVLHPGVVGYAEWGKYCMKGGICAYMQLYLPCSILCTCFSSWQFNGIKSPLYFLTDGVSYFMQFGALANVCVLFAAKCTGVIEGEAMACYHLLSHDEPEKPEKPKEKPAKKDAAETEDVSKKTVALIPSELPSPPHWLLDWNEWLWCSVNIFVSCASSVMLMTAMYMKVATFTGDVMNIAGVTVSLYFVFDLDRKILESDDKLKGRFGRHVLKQTVPTTADPLWIKSASSYTIGFLNATVPLGLLVIFTISWRQVLDAAGMPIGAGENFIVIGSNTFKQ